jgi:hypothetical protein
MFSIVVQPWHHSTRFMELFLIVQMSNVGQVMRLHLPVEPTQRG